MTIQHSTRPGTPQRPLALALALAAVIVVALVAGAIAYFLQAAKNHNDADERFAALSHRVTQGIAERLQRYEYGLRGTRGVVAAGDGHITRDAFARYAASRQIDREFPGARGFGVIYRVAADQEAAFVKARHQGDLPGFAIRAMKPHDGDRFVITYVEPFERNREAIGLDIASEPARREAALRAASTDETALTAPLTLVQASGKRSGGLLLLLPIHRRAGDGQELVGWSYAPLLIEDILRGLDDEETHFALSLFDLDQNRQHPFYATGGASALSTDADAQRITIPLYGRRWEARLQPTDAFIQAQHQASPWGEAAKAALLASVLAALLATVTQLVERTRGQRLEQARRAAIVEGSDDAIVVQDLDGTITDWNDGAVRLFGFSREEALGKTATQLLLPAELAEEDEGLRSTVAGGGRVQVFETTRRARDGASIPVSITASPIRDDDGVVVGSAKILRDVRQAKAAEQRMRDLNASLEDQVRDRTALLDDAMREARDANAAKSRFLANVSHEIRTPMNAVIGLSHMLGRTRLDEDQTAMLARIRTAGKALMSLLNDVLDLSKIEAGEMTLETAPFRIEAVIAEVCAIAGVSAEQRGIAFSVTTQGTVPGPLLGDSTRLAQILLNLLSNAVKFTPQGRVELQLQVGAVDGAGLLPLSFTVSDTGIGIPDDVQRRLFQPFVQADASTTRRFGGTGLGLSIVRQLAELLGGHITLHSEPGKGSQFRFDLRLPIAAAEAVAQMLPATDGAAQAPLAGRRLLVVDDNPLNREVADRILHSEGASVSLASDGQQALALLAEGSYEAALMDVQMPVMDGLEATRRIRAMPRLAGMPIIGLTAGVSSDERRLAHEAGMNAVVGKPFDPEALVATLAGLLSHAVPAPAAVPAGPPPDWPAVEGLDARLVFRNLKGDRELFGRMVGAVQRMLEANERMLAMPSPSRQQLDAHIGLLHDLKALAGTLGATALQAAADRGEQLLRSGRWELALAEIASLAEVGVPLAQARIAPAPVPAATAPLDAERLAMLAAQLAARDLAALSTSRELEPGLRTALGALAAQRLVEQVHALEFEAAEQAVQTLVQKLSARPAPAQAA